MKCQEKDLLDRIRRGDADAFKSLFYLYNGRLCLWAYKITGNRDAAKDIIQDFFLKYWENRETLFFFPSFLSYAYRAVYNASLNYLRNNKKFVHGYEVTLSGMPEEDPDSEEAGRLFRLLLKTIGELPEKCRNIFVMTTLEKKKYAEVARLFGISINTVKVQVSKAYRILRQKMGRFVFFKNKDSQE